MPSQLTRVYLAGAVALAAAVAVIPVSRAQAPAAATRDLKLKGDRFAPLTWNELSPAQRTMAEHLLNGERGGLNGPFNVLLRSPEMGDLAQQFGAATRFHSSLPKQLNELAIIITGRYFTSQYEFQAHHRAALQAGLSPAIADAVAQGKRPTGMSKEEAAVYDFCWELLTTKQVSDAHFKAAKDAFGERGVVDLIGVMGWYSTVSMALNVDRYPLPDGQKPELAPLKLP
jgi:4-carboxymuconolactone decarboxylase